MDTAVLRTSQAVAVFLFSVLLAGCGSQLQASQNTLSAPSVTAGVSTATAPPVLLPSSTPACEPGLAFLYDLTIPDNTVVSPGETLDKQWLVQNSGSCNWDQNYRLRLISGDAMGTPTEQAVFPARSGSQATIRIVFTAPQADGDYVSEWQAFDPSGTPFGQPFFMKVTVATP